MKHRLRYFLLILALFVPLIANLAQPPRASADPKSDIQNATFTFQDRANIIGDLGSYGKIDFVDKNISDGDHNYAPTSGNFCDTHGIDLHSGTLNWSASKIYADTVELGYQLGQNCQKVTLSMRPISNPTDQTTGQPAAAALFQWNGNDITTLDGQASAATFTVGSNAPSLYIEQTDHNSECHAYAAISLDSGSTKSGTLYLFDNSADGYSSIPGIGDISSATDTKPASAYSNIAPYFPSGCNVLSGSFHPYGVLIAGKQGSSPPGTGSGPTDTGSGSTLTCAFSSNPLSWIICPVVDALVTVINWVDGLITDQLTVPTDTIFCNSGDPNADTCSAYYATWQAFRNISLGLIVVAGLIMVVSQALGMEILDAYAIRKTLPRLLIAVIAITLSWPLMKFLIILSNDLGFGIRDLLQTPFRTLDPKIDLNFGGNFTNLFFGGASLAAGAVIAVPVWMAFGGVFALLAYAGTAALAILVAILVLILRQVVIILLMLLAPIAIVAYVLPNTQRFYKLWWESFSKVLLMFPLIVAFITVGRIFAAVALNSGSGGAQGAINGLIGFIAYFAPYFMIPMTFRMAGQTMGAFGNFVNSRAQGGFQTLSKFRAGQRQSRVERARGRGFYRGTNRMARFANKVGLYTLDADEQLQYDMGSGTGVGRLTGRAGKRLFGRVAAEQAGIKANMLAEHTAKGVEKANMHYSTAWAALGMRKKLASSMSDEGLKAMDRKYGIDENGKMSRDTGLAAVRWQAPDNGDYHGLVEYAQDMQKFGLDGTEAEFAGKELQAKAGVLSSFGLHMDTQRASLEGVSAAIAAKEGKLGNEDLADIYNSWTGKASKMGPVALAFAHAQMAQLENAASANRQDQRRGKGIRLDKNGKAYSVLSDRMIEEPSLGGREIPAFKSDKAYDLVTSMKGTAVSNAKAETVREMAPVYRSIMSGAPGSPDKEMDRPDLIAKKPGLQANTRETILYGAANPYSDIDQRAEWEKIATDVGIPPEEIRRKTREVEEAATRERGATGGGASSGGDSMGPPTMGNPGGMSGLGAPGL